VSGPEPAPIRRLVGLGSILVDLAIEVPHLPERGGDVLAERSDKNAGGGFNVLSAAGRLGLPSVYAGPHGSGPFGDIVRAALAAEGIPSLLAPNPDLDTGYCVVLVEGGERTFVTVTGADAVVGFDTLRAIAYQAGDAVYVSGYDLAYPEAGVALADHIAALPEGILLVVDPGPLVNEIPVASFKPVLERADIVSLNAREAALMDWWRWAGGRPSAARIVRSGSEGASILGLSGARQSVPAVETRVIDSTGAGDVHVGAMLAGLARGLHLPEAVLLANRAAAYAIGQRGAAMGPTEMQLTEFGAGRW
jgi:ribokinase